MADETLALDAADRTIDELATVGKVFLSAASIVRKAKVLQAQMTGYEAQAGRLKDALTSDRKSLETLRAQMRDATERLRVATEKADGAETERDRRVSLVAHEEETAITQLRIVSQREREQIQRGTDALVAELETKKQGIKTELDQERTTLEGELRLIQADVQSAKDELQRAKDEHAQFIRSVSHPVDPRG